MSLLPETELEHQKKNYADVRPKSHLSNTKGYYSTSC